MIKKKPTKNRCPSCGGRIRIVRPRNKLAKPAWRCEDCQASGTVQSLP